MNAKAKGYLLGTVAAATYGMNPLFALPLYKAGMDPDSVLDLALIVGGGMGVEGAALATAGAISGCAAGRCCR